MQSYVRPDGRTMIALIAIGFLQFLAFQESDCKELCRKPSCTEAAANVVNSMNKTVKPCDDFFEFSCANWIRRNPIQRGGQTWQVMDAMEATIMTNLHKILDSPDKRGDARSIKLARAMYRNCMDLASFKNLGMKPLHDALNKLGLPKHPPSDQEAAKLDISQIAGRAYRFNGIDILASPFIRSGLKSGEENILTLAKPTILMAELDSILQNPSKYGHVIGKVRTYIKDIMKLGGAGKKADEYAKEFMDTANKFANIRLQNDGAYRLPPNKLQTVTDKDAKYWNWASYAKSIFQDTGINVDLKNDFFYVFNIDYFQGLAKVISTTSRGAIARFVYGCISFRIAPETNEESRLLYKKFNRAVFSALPQDPKWLECTKSVHENFDEALTAVYVDKHFSIQQKKKAFEMWKDVSGSFDDMLNEIQWMDSRTKSQAHKKLYAMRALIGFPDWISNSNKLEKFYEPFQVFEGRKYATDAHMKALKIKENLNTWKKMPDINKWIESPATVNAVYAPTLNSVTIPAGILHIPYYGSGVEALNYGAIGAIMGHELTHGFDSNGRKYDSRGHIHNWWSDDTLKHYSEQVECMIKQYSGYDVTQLRNRVKLSGVNSQGENIADNGGLTEAFRAYQKLKAREPRQPALPGLEQYTDEQLFFLGFAQVWCGSDTNEYLKRRIESGVHLPNRFRVIGTLHNNAEFAKAWGCSRGSPMNPKKKCIVW